MIAVTAREVPEIRARMTDWTRDPTLDGAANWFRFFLGPSPDGATESRTFDRVDDVGATIAAMLAVQLPAAELFYVAADMTDLARHAADMLTDYRLHPEDLPAQVGFMVYEHPPVEETATGPHNAVSMVSWGPGPGGLWVHSWATTSPSQHRVVRIGRALARLPHDEILARARTAAIRDLPEPTSENKSSESDEAADQVVDYVLATFLPNLERTAVPPSFVPPHGYEWCALMPMQFTEMEDWPGGVSEAQPSPGGQAAARRRARERPAPMTSLPPREHPDLKGRAPSSSPTASASSPPRRPTQPP